MWFFCCYLESIFQVNFDKEELFPFGLQTFANNLFQEGDNGEPKFDPSGYDKDLVEHLERDIVQRNPNVHW